MKMIIGGKKVDASNGQTIDVLNPATMQVIDTVPSATKEDIDAAVTNAVEGYKEWSQLCLGERVVILRKFLELYRANMEELAQLVSEDGGKTINDARACIGWTADIIDTYIEWSRYMNTDVIPEGIRAGNKGDLTLTVRQPLGVVVAIIPFNYPIDQLTHKAIPALVMGNSLIVKPATVTPRADIRYVELLLEAGVPANAVQIVTGRGGQVGEWLASDPRIAKVAFTGSTPVGKRLGQICMGNMHHTSLELGGNDALIVLDDANLDWAADLCVGHRTANSGQTCCSPKRFIVQENVKDEFIKKCIERLEKLQFGDLKDPATTLGPVVSLEAAEDAERQIAHTVAQGGKIVYGGKRFNQTFIEPTIIEVSKDADIAKDMEVFAPVMPIIPCKDEKEAVEIANQSMYGLSSGVFSQDVKRLLYVGKNIQAGACHLNGTGMCRACDIPFGGWKQSGIGREGGKYTLEAMSQLKTISFNQSF